MEKHLNPEDELREKGYGFVMVECKYKCEGWFQKWLIKKQTGHKHPSEEASDMALLIEELTTDI